MNFLSKLFGTSKPMSESKIVPDGATLRDVVGIAVNSVIEQAGGNCATLEPISDPTKWIQIMDSTINCHYPHKDSPDWLFPELINHPIVAGLEDFQEETSMTVSLNAMNQSAIVEWIEQYLSKVLLVDLQNARITLRMEQL